MDEFYLLQVITSKGGSTKFYTILLQCIFVSLNLCQEKLLTYL